MKKFISLILASTIITALLCVPITATSTMPAPVFSMDISEYTNANKIVKNGVTNSASGITVKTYTQNTSSSGPIKMEQMKATGDAISYLSFSSPEKVVAGSASDAQKIVYLGNIMVNQATMSSLLDYDFGDMAVEFWAKSYNNYAQTENGDTKPITSAIFSYGRENHNNTTFMSADLMANGSERVTPIGIANYKKSDGSSVAGANRAISTTSTNDWTHYVITRNWTEENTTTHVGDFDEIKVYKNGEQIYSNSTSWDIYNHDISASPANFALWSLAIGGWQNSSASVASDCFYGGISEFNVYSEHLTAEQALALYNEDAELYTAEDVDEWSTATATLDSTEGVLASDESMTITFNIPMLSSTLIDKITLKNNRTKKEVPIKVGDYDAVNQSIDVTFLEYLDDNTEYSFNFGGVRDADNKVMFPRSDAYSFTTAPTTVLNSVSFQNQSGETITNISGETSVKAVIDATNKQIDAQNYMVYIAYYDASGTMQDIEVAVVSGVMQDAKLLSADGTNLLSVELTGLLPVEGSKVRCFVFNTTTGQFSATLPVYTEIVY